MTESLSPAANAVLDAFLNGFVCRQSCNVAFEADRNGLAAALRAVADQVVPEQKPWHRTGLPGSTRHDVRAELLAIANELRHNETL